MCWDPNIINFDRRNSLSSLGQIKKKCRKMLRNFSVLFFYCFAIFSIFLFYFFGTVKEPDSRSATERDNLADWKMMKNISNWVFQLYLSFVFLRLNLLCCCIPRASIQIEIPWLKSTHTEQRHEFLFLFFSSLVTLFFSVGFHFTSCIQIFRSLRDSSQWAKQKPTKFSIRRRRRNGNFGLFFID